MHIPDLDYKKLLKIITGIFVGGTMLGFFLIPVIEKIVVRSLMKIPPGSQMRKRFYMNIPFPLHLSVYIFNLTNPDEIQAGGKPSVQQVGPYKFEVWKSKYDPEDDDKEDTLSFNLKNTYIFKPESTLPLTGNELVTIPNLIYMGGLIITQRASPSLLPIAIAGLTEIFDQPTSPFVSVRAMDLLFDGIVINCDKEGFQAQAVCGKLAVSLGETSVIDDTHYAFSLFKPDNGTDSGRFKVKRGVENVQDIGKVIEYNEEVELDVHDGEECNQIKGTDGLFFPPFRKRTDTIWAFSNKICRSVPFWFSRKSSYRGVKLSRFVTHFGTEPVCYCREEEVCPPDGTIDLTNCFEAPLIAAKPHFYDADASLVQQVNGLAPDAAKHDLVVDFDLFLGAPLTAAQRLQINLDMQPVPDSPIMQNLPEVILPFFWIEEALLIEQPFLFLFQMDHFLKGFTSFLKWTSLFIGLLGIPICVICLHMISGSRVQQMNPSLSTTRESSASEPSVKIKVNKGKSYDSN